MGAPHQVILRIYSFSYFAIYINNIFLKALLNGEYVRGGGYRGHSERLPLGVIAGIGILVFN